ncbi:hypothetical protein D3C86_2152990 [compost metagenome]
METRSFEAVVSIGGEQRFFLSAIYVVPTQVVRLKEAEVVVKRTPCRFPRITRADSTAEQVVAQEFVGFRAALHAVP